jgi:hypothetical protein
LLAQQERKAAELAKTIEDLSQTRKSLTEELQKSKASLQSLTDQVPQKISAATQPLAAEIKAKEDLLAQQERNDSVDTGAANKGGDYIAAFRDYKYYETLFELFAKQYEIARIDEAREGPVIQIVDVATPPERKSKPKKHDKTMSEIYRPWLRGGTVLCVLLIALLLSGCGKQIVYVKVPCPLPPESLRAMPPNLDLLPESSIPERFRSKNVKPDSTTP